MTMPFAYPATFLPPGGSGMGNIFFVDHINGLNTNEGVDPAFPVQTITFALTLCTADHNDYIFVLEHGAAGVEPAYPIVVNINKVHLIGVGRQGPDQIIRLHGDGNDVMQITGRDVEIAGFGFDTVGAAGDGITEAAIFGTWIHHCHFAGSSLGQGLANGISGTLNWALIEDCVFSSPNGVGCTAHGISGNLVCCIIRRNYFTAPAAAGGECIHSGNVEIGQIVDNYFYSPISDAGVVGWAIFLEGAGMEGGPITNNHAMQTGDGTGNNPYRDTSTGVLATTSHGWGMNYSGPAVLAPAFV